MKLNMVITSQQALLTTVKTYSFVPTEDTFPADRVAGASHFGEYDEGAQLHTRTGDFPVRGTDSRALYLGEIQSDAQQKHKQAFIVV